LSDPRTNYCKHDAPDHCVQRHDKHVIHQICEIYGFENVELKCELYLTEDELWRSEVFKGWIVIDPDTKDEYTVNKRYPTSKWQHVVDVLNAEGHHVVQVGRKTSNLLRGVMDCTGQTTFREAAAIIKHAKLFIGSEGGLMHAANAVGTSAVILVTGFLHPRMTCYPENKNIWIGKEHGPCGMKIRCQKCFAECMKHDEMEIVAAAKEMLA
jgi:ADP-heptose:LPS heptosyltransferase